MSKRIQPGVRIDEDLYERFKTWVRSHYGDRRGAVGMELERALEAHMESAEGGGAIHRIEEDISSINAGVGSLIQRIDDMERRLQKVESDGGTGTAAKTPPADSGGDTHTYEPDDTEADDVSPPHRRVSPVSDRARYIIEHGDVVSNVIEDAHAINPRTIEDDVDDVWGYAKDETTRKVVDTVAEQLGAYPYFDPDYHDEWKLYFGDEPAADGAKSKPGKTGADAMAFIRRESKKHF